MSFDWKTYLEVSEMLVKHQITGLEEACLRSAISRAYYAAFGTANSYLKNKGQLFLLLIPTNSYEANLRNRQILLKRRLGTI